MRWRWAFIITGVAVGISAGAIFKANDVARALETKEPSQSIGSPANGRLVNGKRLPTAGPNFRTYSYLGAALGRNAVHEHVRTAILEAYAELHDRLPALRFVYGETGWTGGGRFRPHRTHQNGLSVDFMVPVVDASGRSVPLPTHPLNLFGYGLEFDRTGRCGDLRIDFYAMAAHLAALDRASRRQGLTIRRVIFAPELQPLLFSTSGGSWLRNHLPLWRGRAWVRHDEHYHVDFDL